MAFIPPKFGPKSGIDSKDYILWKQGQNGPTDTPISLFGHGLTSPSQNLAEALVYSEVVLRSGRVVVVNRIKRAAYETDRTYTVGFPSALWTPLMNLPIGCPVTLYLIYNCPEDRIFNHWDILPEGYMNPPIEAEDLITIGTETNIVTQTADINVTEKLRGWELGFSRVYDTTVTLESIAFLSQECADCNFSPGQTLVAAGGDGTAAPVAPLTDNRFGSVTALTSGAGAGNVNNAVFTEGDLIVIGFGDDEDLATAATGGVRYSLDRGATFAAATGIADAVFDIVALGNTLVAVTGDGTNGGLFISENRGVTWVEVVNADVNSAGALDVAVADNDNGFVYMAGAGGKLLSGQLSGSSMNVFDISAGLPGSPGDLRGIAVLAPGHIIVGGAAGYLAESQDGGATWAEVASGTTSTIRGIAGNIHRCVIAAGSTLLQRCAPTKNAFQLITLEFGQTIGGAYTDLIMGLENNFNLFAATTAVGEVVIGKGFYPTA